MNYAFNNITCLIDNDVTEITSLRDEYERSSSFIDSGVKGDLVSNVLFNSEETCLD